MHRIKNFLTERGVCLHVMHRCRYWTVFSASLFRVNWTLIARQFAC